MTPAEFYRAAIDRARNVLVEVDEPFGLMLGALLVGGNVLVEGVPGTAKTLMARSLAALLGGNSSETHFSRIQFTPDLMPSDILGTNVFHAASASFTFRPGPIFANVVVADEVNRAPAKTQSALLEAMEEHQVTVEGQRLPLPRVFLVVATQNPIEFEGTYPLPEAQMDRFVFKLLVDHLSGEAERDVVLRHDRGLDVTDLAGAGLAPLVDADGVLELRAQVARVRVDVSVAGYMVAINRATRTLPEVENGASVRGALGLLNGAKVTAAFADRNFVVPDDVKYVAPAVLRHRIVLKPEAELDGVRPDDVIDRILTSVPVPR
ncbi:MAG: AAA family ATPase [Chloroflexi bacterium]|nr:AAA family ATPase [Chloroflexota bacterium]